MQLGYIQKYDLTINPNLTERFKFRESNYTVRTTKRGKRVYSKMFSCPLDYEDIESNTDILKKTPNLMIIQEPVFLDDELRDRIVRWVEWANKADPKEYDPFYEEDGAGND